MICDPASAAGDKVAEENRNLQRLANLENQRPADPLARLLNHDDLLESNLELWIHFEKPSQGCLEILATHWIDGQPGILGFRNKGGIGHGCLEGLT